MAGVLAALSNDAADVAVGSAESVRARIDRLMRRVAGAPALWLTTRSLRNEGPYAESRMQQCNQALEQACAHHRNMRIYLGGAEVKPGWSIDDGIRDTPGVPPAGPRRWLFRATDRRPRTA